MFTCLCIYALCFDFLKVIQLIKKPHLGKMASQKDVSSSPTLFVRINLSITLVTLPCFTFLCTFSLNLSVFLVISHTSALTIRIAGVVKDRAGVLLSALLFVDIQI